MFRTKLSAQARPVKSGCYGGEYMKLNIAAKISFSEDTMANDALNRTVSAKSAADAFVKTLEIVRDRGISVPADESMSVGAKQPTRELQNFTVCIEDARCRLIRSPKYSTSLVSSVARFVWMMAGNNRLADIVFYEDKANSFSDDGLTMPGSNYGMRMLQPRPGLNQLAGVISELQEHPSSRRAMVSIFHPEDATRQKSADIPWRRRVVRYYNHAF
jgi:hypothetical protein